MVSFNFKVASCSLCRYVNIYIEYNGVKILTLAFWERNILMPVKIGNKLLTPSRFDLVSVDIVVLKPI